MKTKQTYAYIHGLLKWIWTCYAHAASFHFAFLCLSFVRSILFLYNSCQFTDKFIHIEKCFTVERQKCSSIRFVFVCDRAILIYVRCTVHTHIPLSLSLWLTYWESVCQSVSREQLKSYIYSERSSLGVFLNKSYSRLKKQSWSIFFQFQMYFLH